MSLDLRMSKFRLSFKKNVQGIFLGKFIKGELARACKQLKISLSLYLHFFSVVHKHKILDPGGVQQNY